MKIFALIIAFLFSSEIYAIACKCNCEAPDRTICAPLYDIDYPCGVSCNSAAPPAGGIGIPMGRTACPTIKVYNQDKGIMEWRTFCWD